MFHSLPLLRKPSQIAENVTPGPTVLRLQDFGLEAGGVQLLSGVTFDLRIGEALGLIGRAGAGKSLLMRAMCRLLEQERLVVTRGSLQHRGQEIFGRGFDTPEMRAKVVYIPEVANPFPMSVWDNIAYGVKLNRIATRRREMADHVEAALRRCRLWDELKDVLHTQRATALPPYQQRLLCLARSLALNPDVVMLDQPTGSIDQQENESLHDIAMDLKSDHAVVFATASLADTARLADRVAYLEEGALVEIDSAEMILTAALAPQTRAFLESTSA
ncbi:ATP-binding cassette domain-containing protein [Tritonibacter mobilis]|jgi:phosphate transport system ATP-binding protein|nr:ATP-binding cassette domain-containing protein [Tritonibacter mobilis]